MVCLTELLNSTTSENKLYLLLQSISVGTTVLLCTVKCDTEHLRCTSSLQLKTFQMLNYSFHSSFMFADQHFENVCICRHFQNSENTLVRMLDCFVVCFFHETAHACIQRTMCYKQGRLVSSLHYSSISAINLI